MANAFDQGCSLFTGVCPEKCEHGVYGIETKVNNDNDNNNHDGHVHGA